jgi:hypothetical protein
MTFKHGIAAFPLLLALTTPLRGASTSAHEPSRWCQACVECTARTIAPRVLRLRIYNQAHVNDSVLVTILDVANRIWSPYGVSIETAENPDAVSVVLSDRLMHGQGGGPLAVGDTVFMKGHATPYIHLWLGGARLIAENAELDGPPYVGKPKVEQTAILARMLGVALAHEVAHYLLDTTAHSADGLLRSVINPRDMEDPNPAHLRLTHKEQKLLQRSADC